MGTHDSFTSGYVSPRMPLYNIPNRPDCDAMAKAKNCGVDPVTVRTPNIHNSVSSEPGPPMPLAPWYALRMCVAPVIFATGQALGMKAAKVLISTSYFLGMSMRSVTLAARQ